MMTRIFLLLGLLGALTAQAAPMVKLDGGSYRPLYLSEDSPMTTVEPFKMDVSPVTNADFYDFVQKKPKWQREKISGLFAEKNYLHHWQKTPDGYAPMRESMKQPVTYISWFAANAYCQAQGKKLPTVAQWEYAGSASETQILGSQEEGYNQKILEWYSKPTRQTLPNVGMGAPNYWGIYDLHGVIWEWTEDFNSALVTGESRADSNLNQNMFCGSGSAGAADPSDYAAFMRYAFRASLKARFTLPALGFRCAE